MTGTGIEYLVGLFLVGTSLDSWRLNTNKIIGGIILIVLAILGIAFIH